MEWCGVIVVVVVVVAILASTGYWKATGPNFGNRFNSNQFTSKLVKMEILAC